MKNSLSAKIFTGITAILLVISLLIFVMLWIVMPRTYGQRLSVQFVNDMQDLTAMLESSPKDQWENLLFLFALENNIDVNILDENNNTILSFYANESISSIEYDKATSTYISSSIVSNEVLSNIDSSLGLGFSFEQDGNFYNLVSVAYDDINMRAITEISAIFPQVFPYVLVMILFLSICAALFYSRFLAKPIVEIAHVSKKMANLDMSWHCETNRTDEVGLLANHLNQMATQLTTTLQELQTANIKLQADIKKEREHERRRRDFFTAVSHELKTPVTILKGELDGMILKVGKFKDRDKYLQEAYKTSESIEKLVREIMTLAKLDNINLKLEDVNLSELMTDVSNIYEPLAQQKQMNIKLDLTHIEAVIIKADKIQLQTVISNIISNAVKHSQAGQNIEISLIKENECGLLTVENKGVHIDDEELSKLWEPFYRTDKSRSRDTGGSGLGLYIVKTILDLHGFSYRLKNSENGIKFTMTFKSI